MSFGKWIAGGLGWAFGGPLGGILGFALGAMYDNASSDRMQWGTDARPDQAEADVRTRTTVGDFEASLLVLTAAVMKADDRIMRSELEFVKAFLNKQFGEAKAQEHLILLREVLKHPINVREVSEQIRRYMDHPARLQLMHYLFALALSDGDMHRTELDMLNRIASYLGIGKADLDSIKAMFGHNTTDYYKVLEIEPSATDEEVKKAYRRMALRYHPDKVIHLGPEHQANAEEMIRKVNEAYEKVMKERGSK